MKDKYDEVFDEITKLYTEEAKPLLSEKKIDAALEREKNYIEYIRNAGLSPDIITRGNTAKYCKDMVRKDQPLYFLYYILGLLTGISYCMLFWLILKCTAMYLLGHADSFTSGIPLSYSLYIVSVYYIFNDIINYVQKKSAINNKSSLHLSFLRIIELILISGGCAVIYGLSAFKGLFKISLLNAFLITAGLLFLSGIHNVIYSSRFISFLTIGVMTLIRKPASVIDDALADYIKRNDKPQDTLIRQLKSDSTYCYLGLFMAVILDIICLKQLLIHLEVKRILFFIAVVIITLLLFTAIISCKCVISALKTL